MEDQEIRERYGLKGKRHAVILLITMVLLILSIVPDAIAVMNPANYTSWLNSIIAVICSLFPVIYATECGTGHNGLCHDGKICFRNASAACCQHFHCHYLFFQDRQKRSP